MSRFYGTMDGGRKPVSRTGHALTGMEAHLRGWNHGVRVKVCVKDGREVFEVYKTSGSNGSSSDDRLLTELNGAKVDK